MYANAVQFTSQASGEPVSELSCCVQLNLPSVAEKAPFSMTKLPPGPLPVPLKVLSLWWNVKSYRTAAVFPSSVCVPAHAPFGGRSSSKGGVARFAGRETA